MAAQDEFDPWAGGSGLLDDYAGTIVDAFFTKDPSYNNGETLLLSLKVRTDNPDTPEVENRYACGPDWDSFDGGDTAEHPKGKTFNGNTQLMQLVVAAFGCPPVSDKTWDMGGKVGVQQISDAEFYLRTKGSEIRDAEGMPLGPRAAKNWVGTSWHWTVKTETRKFRDRQTNEEIERTTSRPFPDTFLGLVDVNVGGAGTDEFATPGPTTAPVGAPPGSPAPGAPAPAPAAAQPAPATPASAASTQPPQPAQPSAPSAPAPSAPAPSAPSAPGAIPTPAAPTQPAASPAPGQPQVPASQDSTILARVKILAETLPYPQWVDEVLSLPGVAQDENFVAALGTEDYYNQLKGG